MNSAATTDMEISKEDYRSVSSSVLTLVLTIYLALNILDANIRY